MRILIILLICVLTAFSFGSEEVDNVGPNPDQVKNMRNFQYCEILVSNNRLGFWKIFELTAFNTLMFGCDMKKWNALTEEDVKKQFGATLVKMNGPRYWLMDSVDTSRSILVDSSLTFIGGIKWVVVGVVDASLYDIFTKLFLGYVTNYMERTVARKTIYVFRKDELVYVMTTPEGKTFIMQSYCSMDHPQTIEDLSHLDTTMKKPAGWRYNVYRLEEDLYVEAENAIGHIINDEYFNSYSQFDSKLLIGQRVAGTDYQHSEL